MGWCLAHVPILELPDDDLEAHLLVCKRARPPALVLGLLTPAMIFPPPWFVAVEAPACCAELDVPPEQTNDAIARHFVCDKPIDDHADGRHRQVVDNELGHTFEWLV